MIFHVLNRGNAREQIFHKEADTTTHVPRWHLQRRTVGSGHLYQGT
jgi:hypothetical protein